MNHSDYALPTVIFFVLPDLKFVTYSGCRPPEGDLFSIRVKDGCVFTKLNKDMLNIHTKVFCCAALKKNISTAFVEKL